MNPLNEVARARRWLAKRPASSRSVHEARLSLKRARAVLRLGKGTAVEAPCERSRAACRRAARALGPLRDERMAAQTLEEILARRARKLPPRAVERGRALAERERRAESRGLARGAALRRARALLSAVPRAPGPAEFDRAVRPALGVGLRRSLRRARKGYRAARASPGKRRFHALRKRSKTLLLELEALGPGAARAAALADLRRLGKLLGREHDLSVLRERLGREAPAAVLRLARRRRRKLRRRALVLAKSLFSRRGLNSVTDAEAAASEAAPCARRARPRSAA